jgi:hypothetical protein
LRTRLNTYYQTAGKTDPILIVLPKGGYVPEFSENKLETPAQKARNPAPFLIAGAMIGFAVAALLLFNSRRVPESTATLRLSILPPSGAVIEHSTISPDVSSSRFQVMESPDDSLRCALLRRRIKTWIPLTPCLSPENHELGEEIVASYLYQVHLYEWLEANDYGRFLADDDL